MNDEMSQEKIEEYHAYWIKRYQESLTRLCIAYDCECGARTYYALDRFPMSYKIGFQCESCKIFDFRKIVEPFVYYSKIHGEFESAEDIVFMDPTDIQRKLLMQHCDFEKQYYKYHPLPQGER